jgi:lipoprotein-anchoring transpeptidase ErfK/SrfK
LLKAPDHEKIILRQPRQTLCQDGSSARIHAVPARGPDGPRNQGRQSKQSRSARLAKRGELWPFCRRNGDEARVRRNEPDRNSDEDGMKGLLAFLTILMTLVALAQSAQAQVDDPDLLLGGSPANKRYQFFSGGYPDSVTRTTVSFAGDYKPGSIFINTAERRLYFMLGNGQAVRYGIGVGRDGFRWSGVHRVTAKKEWPDWTPPAQMLRRRPDLPRHMKGGEDNPLGARAMYLGSTLYRIHGSNEPETIGQAVSSGCFRMTNADVVDLYNRVQVGTTVVVKN